MRYNVATVQYTIIEDNIDTTFSSLGDRDSKISFTIEGAEQFIIELNNQIQLAKEARTLIIREDIKKIEDLVREKQSYVEKRKNDLKSLLERMSTPKEVKI